MDPWHSKGLGLSPDYGGFAGAAHQDPQLSSYGGFSSSPPIQSFERPGTLRAHQEDFQRSTGGYKSGKGKGGKGSKSHAGKDGWSGKAAPEPERKVGGCGGVIAELTSDGRLGTMSRNDRTQSDFRHSRRPQTSQAFDKDYSRRVDYKVSEPDDDWAKNPDIFSSANYDNYDSHAWDQPQAHVVPSSGGRCASLTAKMPYAGIAAELTSDGRLRADWRASEGHDFEASRQGKGNDSWSNEWRGSVRSFDENYWSSPASKGKGKGKSKKGKDKAAWNSLDRWYGWSKNEQVDGWEKGSVDRRVPDRRVPAFSPGAEQPQDMDEQYGQYGHWHPQGQAGELRDPQEIDQKKQRRRRKKKKAAFEKANAMSIEEREVLARARREELSAEKEAEAKGIPRLLKSTDWEEVVADEHLCSWMSIQRSNPAVLAEDFQILMDRALWKDIDGTCAEAREKAAWMVASGCQCEHRYNHGILEPVEIPDWMSGLMERWLSILSLERDQLPNSVEVTWFDDARDARWLSDDESLFRTPTQDIHVICVALGGPRLFRAGLRCGTRFSTPVRGTVSEVTLSHGDTCAIEGRFQKHFVHQSVGRQVENDGSSSNEGYLHVTFRWIVKHSRNCPLHEHGASEAEEPSEDDVSSASAASDDGEVE